jgi:putative transposase
MSQSLVQIYLHIVFSKKHRHPFLTDSIFRNRAHAYLAGMCKKLASPAIIIGGVADHVHIRCRLSKTGDVSSLIRDLKRDSTTWIKLENPSLHEFHWQNGYGAFSLSPGHVEPVKGYVAKQDEHHKAESFQDEFRRLCQKYAVELDERYVWD